MLLSYHVLQWPQPKCVGRWGKVRGLEIMPGWVIYSRGMMEGHLGILSVEPLLRRVMGRALEVSTERQAMVEVKHQGISRQETSFVSSEFKFLFLGCLSSFLHMLLSSDQSLSSVPSLWTTAGVSFWLPHAAVMVFQSMVFSFEFLTAAREVLDARWIFNKYLIDWAMNFIFLSYNRHSDTWDTGIYWKAKDLSFY